EGLALSKQNDYDRAVPMLDEVAGMVRDALAKTSGRPRAEKAPPADFPEAAERAFLSRWEPARDAWRDAIESVDAQISQLQVAMKDSGFPEISAVADAGLNGATP